MGYEGFFERIPAGLGDQVTGCADGQNPARMHQGNAVTALRLVHEVGGDEDRHAVIAGKFRQQIPESVPGHRVDTAGWLVENKHFRLVQHGDSELQALANAERQGFRPLVHHLGKIEAVGQLPDPFGLFLSLDAEQARVQVEILTHCQLAIERE